MHPGCLGVPLYDECDSQPIFSCSTVCQKADWDQHKSECRQLQARKTLGRAHYFSKPSSTRFEKLGLPRHSVQVAACRRLDYTSRSAWVGHSTTIKPVSGLPKSTQNVNSAIAYSSQNLPIIRKCPLLDTWWPSQWRNKSLPKNLSRRFLYRLGRHGGKLNAILKVSDATFKQAKDRFLE